MVSAEVAGALGRADGAATVEQIHRDQRIVARARGDGPRARWWVRGGPSNRAGVAELLLFLNVKIAGAQPPRASPSSTSSSARSVRNTYRRLDWATHYDLRHRGSGSGRGDREGAARAGTHLPPRPSPEVASRGRPRRARGAVRPRPDRRTRVSHPERAQGIRPDARGERGHHRAAQHGADHGDPEGHRPEELRAREGAVRGGGLLPGVRDDASRPSSSTPARRSTGCSSRESSARTRSG